MPELTDEVRYASTLVATAATALIGLPLAKLSEAEFKRWHTTYSLRVKDSINDLRSMQKAKA